MQAETELNETERATAMAEFVSKSLDEILADTDNVKTALMLWFVDVLKKADESQARNTVLSYENLVLKKANRDLTGDCHTAKERLAGAMAGANNARTELANLRRAIGDAGLAKNPSLQASTRIHNA